MLLILQAFRVAKVAVRLKNNGRTYPDPEWLRKGFLV